jgi:hypothetical protein
LLNRYNGCRISRSSGDPRQVGHGTERLHLASHSEQGKHSRSTIFGVTMNFDEPIKRPRFRSTALACSRRVSGACDRADRRHGLSRPNGQSDDAVSELVTLYLRVATAPLSQNIRNQRLGKSIFRLDHNARNARIGERCRR